MNNFDSTESLTSDDLQVKLHMKCQNFSSGISLDLEKFYPCNRQNIFLKKITFFVRYENRTLV